MRRSERGGNRVQQKIEPIRLLADFAKKICNLLVFGNVAWKERRRCAELSNQLFDVFLQALPLIIENQFRARSRPCFGNCPRDAALVCDTEHDAGFPSENLFLHAL